MTSPDLETFREKANRAIGRSLEAQLTAAQTVIEIAKRCETLDERQTKCLRSVRNVLQATEIRLMRSELNPVDIMAISAKLERLWFQIDSLS
jgi:hypothetical protein